MPNLKIFGSPIHDTALVFIATSTIFSIFVSSLVEIGRFEANLIVGFGAIVSFGYWYKEYRIKK